jgi:pyruvate,water dikinase
VGPARLVRSLADWGKVRAGDIIVTSVIDPGMAPLFVIAAGLVAEMGGTLSHGAIIAREYGLPAVVNVPGATAQIHEGDTLLVDAVRGEIAVKRETGVTP